MAPSAFAKDTNVFPMNRNESPMSFPAALQRYVEDFDTQKRLRPQHWLEKHWLSSEQRPDDRDDGGDEEHLERV